MNTAMFLRAAASRWYLVLLGLALTAYAAGSLYLRPPTVYWAETTVTLLQPDPNPLTAEGYPMTYLASALAVQVNGHPASSKTASPDTTLYGEGVREGSRVRLRDVGGQWTTSIPAPLILVEAVGPEPDAVEASIGQQVERLHDALAQMQNELDVDDRKRIFLQPYPEQPEVIPITGSRTRAAGGAALLGCGATGVSLYLVDRRWPQGRPNRRK